MRIIHCFRSPVGGVFRHVRDLIDIHIADGHEVGIVCDSSTGGAYEAQLFRELEPQLKLGLTRISIGRSIGPKDICSLVQSYRHIKAAKPDIIHGHSAKGGAIARVIGTLLRFQKLPVVRLYSPHGGSLHYDQNSIKGRLFFLAERAMERYTDAICYVCDYEKRIYAAKIGQPRPISQTIYNGLRREEFSPVKLAPDAGDFLYIGMMRDLKGPQVFIEAIHLLTRDHGRAVTAHMVGDGPDKIRYEHMIKTLGLDQSITLHEAMPARQAFALAKTVVVPSLAEAMPYIVLEAAAAGKPIIASRVGGIPEILGSSNADVIEPGHSALLATRMMVHSDVSHPISEASTLSTEFRERFSAEAMGASMLSLYQRLLNQVNSAK